MHGFQIIKQQVSFQQLPKEAKPSPKQEQMEEWLNLMSASYTNSVQSWPPVKKVSGNQNTEVDFQPNA